MAAEGETNPLFSIEELVGRFEVLLDGVRASTQRIRFDPDNRQYLVAMALHATLLELARGITELIKVDDATGPPILLRTLLEAYVDLKNLVADAIAFVKGLVEGAPKGLERVGPCSREPSGALSRL